MTITKVQTTIYTTSDGTVFHQEDSAEQYETCCEIYSFIKEFKFRPTNLSETALFHWLLENSADLHRLLGEVTYPLNHSVMVALKIPLNPPISKET